ncbi:MAG TPA: hypothetical protein VGG45_18110 [Terracidiphilus sp.]|jgi:hypothetical protein
MIDPAVTVHEAGHAVVARVCGLGVARASAGRDPCVTTVLPNDLSPAKRDVLRFVARTLVDLAGAAAEARAFGMIAVDAVRSDEQNAHWRALQFLRLARGIGDRPLTAEERATCERLVARFRPTAAKLVEQNWPSIEAVAAALAEGRTLNGDEVDGLMAGTT